MSALNRPKKESHALTRLRERYFADATEEDVGKIRLACREIFVAYKAREKVDFGCVLNHETLAIVFRVRYREKYIKAVYDTLLDEIRTILPNNKPPQRSFAARDFSVRRGGRDARKR